MKNLLLLFLTIIFLTECKKDNLSINSSELIGKWSWIESCPGVGHSGCWSPDSFYQAYAITFEPDSTYNFYYGDTLKSSCKIHTFKSLVDNNKDTIYIIKFESGSTDMYSISHDTLNLTNSEGILTITSRYKRIK